MEGARGASNACGGTALASSSPRGKVAALRRQRLPLAGSPRFRPAEMNITDPARRLAPLLLRPRRSLPERPATTSIVALMLQCAAVAAVGVSLFFRSAPVSDVLTAPLYWALLAGVMDRFTLMLHCTSHRQLFNNQPHAP